MAQPTPAVPSAIQISQGSRPSTARSLADRWFWVFLLLIVLVGEAARGFHFILPANSDEQQYVIFARQLTEDVPIPVRPAWSSRAIWGWTLNLWGQVWGLSLERIAVLMFLLAAATMVLVALIGRLVFGSAAGLLGAAVYAAYPINILNDVRTNPDSLAVPVMLVSLWCFIKYLQTRRMAYLAMAGALTGLLVGIKDYFCLVGGVYALGLWKSSADWRQLRNDLLVLIIPFVPTFVLAFVLQRALAGDALTTVQTSLNYVNSYQIRDASRGRVRTPLDVLAERFRYVQYLLFDHGIIGGLLLVAGGIFLAFNAARREVFALFVGALGFALFLSLTPFNFRPLLFIEVQPRYATIFIPYLSIGAGGLLAALFDRLRGDRALYRCAQFAAAVAVLASLWWPNYAYDGVPGAVAIRHAIDETRELKIPRLVFYWHAHRAIPDSWYQRGVRISFAESSPKQNDQEYGSLDRQLKTSEPVAVYVPLHMEKDPEIMRLEQSGDFKRIPVMAPASSLRGWLHTLGVRRRGSLGGYLYVPQNVAGEKDARLNPDARRPTTSTAPAP